ncbi:MAG: hypothetical protein ABI792_01055 [bacterium]
MLLSTVILVLSFVIIFIFDLRIYIKPLILGWLISFLNVLAGSYVINMSYKEKGKGFINQVLLSLVVRLFTVVGLVFILIYFFRIDKISLAFIMFIFYSIFLILEINFLSLKSKNTNT